MAVLSYCRVRLTALRSGHKLQTGRHIASLMTNQSTSHFLHPSNSVYTRAGATAAGGREECRTEGFKQATETGTSFRAVLQLPSTWEKWLFEQKINLESFNTLSCRGWDYSMFTGSIFKSQPLSQSRFPHQGHDYTSALRSIDLIYCGGGQQVNTCKKEYVSCASGRRRGKEVNRCTRSQNGPGASMSHAKSELSGQSVWRMRWY